MNTNLQIKSDKIRDESINDREILRKTRCSPGYLCNDLVHANL